MLFSRISLIERDQRKYTHNWPSNIRYVPEHPSHTLLLPYTVHHLWCYEDAIIAITFQWICLCISRLLCGLGLPDVVHSLVVFFIWHFKLNTFWICTENNLASYWGTKINAWLRCKRSSILRTIARNHEITDFGAKH